MTSVPSGEDVKWAAYEAGIKNPARLNAFMKVVNLYAYSLARKINEVLEDAPASLEKLYLCRGCGDMKAIGEFPESKQKNIAKGVNCNKCQDKRKYKCIGPCRQLKPLDEFPEHKQANPHIPSVCSYCAPKTITSITSRKEPLRDSERITVPASAGPVDRPGMAS